jgi:hypothetical protein
VPKEVRKKLDSKGVKCIFIGYCEDINGYKLYNLISQYVIIMCDVIFYETKGINKEIMVSKLDSKSKYFFLNKKTKDGK